MPKEECLHNYFFGALERRSAQPLHWMSLNAGRDWLAPQQVPAVPQHVSRTVSPAFTCMRTPNTSVPTIRCLLGCPIERSLQNCLKGSMHALDGVRSAFEGIQSGVLVRRKGALLGKQPSRHLSVPSDLLVPAKRCDRFVDHIATGLQIIEVRLALPLLGARHGHGQTAVQTVGILELLRIGDAASGDEARLEVIRFAILEADSEPFHGVLNVSRGVKRS